MRCSAFSAFALTRYGEIRRDNSITRSPVDLALALYFVRVLLDGCKPSADTRRASTFASFPCGHSGPADKSGETPAKTFCQTSGETPLRRFARQCACTHYLVFKEPECSAFPETAIVQPRRVPTERPFPSVLGEPSEVTTRYLGCQAPGPS